MSTIGLQEVATAPGFIALRCCETGIVYQIERCGDSYIVRNSGHPIGRRTHRDQALELVKQTAALDFRTAQAESAFRA
jgi:hypothetical protein